MDPATLAMIFGGVSNIAGGLMGASAQGNAAQQAKDAYDQSVKDLTAIGIPSVEAQKITMQQYKSQGKWTPELEQTVQLGDSAMGNISTDPANKQAQQNALMKLQEIGNSGGMTLADQANLEKIQGNISADQRGAREAILQRAHQSGGYGSGTSLAAQLMAQQGGAAQAHQAGLDTAATAQARALAAIQGAGQMGTNLRSQEFDEKAKQAQAADQIAQWNAANRQNVAGTNTGTANQAQQYNLNNAQSLSNANVDTANKQEVYNQGLLQQNYQNQMANAQAKAAARSGQAQNALAAGNSAAGMWSGIGSGVGQAATAYGQQQNDQANQDKNRDLYAKRYNIQPT